MAVMSTALNNSGQLQPGHAGRVDGDGQERIVEQFGEIRYTIGTGCSGGALAQQQVANAYPGIYQGILPACSFPDAWSTGQQPAAYNLLRAYHENPASGRPAWSGTRSRSARRGPEPRQLDRLRHDLLDRPRRAGRRLRRRPRRADLQRRDEPRRRPLHARRLHDQRRRAALVRRVGPAGAGPRARLRRPPARQRRRAVRARPLKKGLITPAQFVDLNAKIGGRSIDIQPTAERFAASPGALRNAYLSGAVNSTNNMDALAVIDLRGPDPGAFHDAYRSWAIRARMEREQGGFPKNHVIWFGAAADRRLRRRRRGGHGPLARRGRGGHQLEVAGAQIADNRPADIHDQCSNVAGVGGDGIPGVGTVCEHEQLQTRYGTPTPSRARASPPTPTSAR